MRNIAVVLFLTLGVFTESIAGESNKDYDNTISQYMAVHEYVGLAIVASKGKKVVFDKAYGYTDLNGKEPFSSDKVISLGSNAKTLTAASILLLQEKGLLKLSDTLDKYLPLDLKHSGSITLEDMLCHRSDLADVYGAGEYENYVWQQAKSQKEFIDKLNLSTHIPDAGKEYRYNNTAYFLLGMVVEHVSHQSLGDFFRESIFSHMPETKLAFLGDSFYSPSLTPAFQNNGTKMIEYVSPVEYRIVGGAGALAGDLPSYTDVFAALMSGKVVDY